MAGAHFGQAAHADRQSAGLAFLRSFLFMFTNSLPFVIDVYMPKAVTFVPLDSRLRRE